MKPREAARGTGERVAIVGYGPAGLACAQQLARAGHAPTVFEKSDRVGGLLRYEIPDFQLEKHGQSLAVWVIREGRECAASVNVVIKAEAPLRSAAA